jgi:membrane protein
MSMAPGGGEHKREAVAREPTGFSRAEWWRAAGMTWRGLSRDNLPVVGVGVVFLFLLLAFPALAGLISAFGFFLDPEQVLAHLESLDEAIPEEAYEVLLAEVASIVRKGQQGGAGFLLGGVLAVWAGFKATHGVINALNLVYAERETRSFLRLALVALALTLAILLFCLVVVFLLLALPPLLQALGQADKVTLGLKWARWPVLAVTAMTTITLIYRFAPCRNQPKWTGLTWGSGSATAVWLLASWLFALYVRNVGGFDSTYGSLAGVVVVMLWLYLSSLAVLMGAEFDEALEDVMREKRGEEKLHSDR